MPRPINVAEDIIPIAQFKTHASEYLRRMKRTRRPMVITQSGKPAAVVLTPEEFEELGYREYVKARVKAGLESAAAGQNVPLDEAVDEVLGAIDEVERKPARAPRRAR